jgi:hypothetical protein
MGWIRNLSKKAWAVIGAVGVVLGVILGVIQFVDWGRSISESPIRADYGHTGVPAFGAIVGDFDPSRNPDYYLQERLVAYSHPFVFVDVTSQVDDETITLSPYLVVEVTDVRPMPENVNYVHYPTGGGGATIIPFVATLAPEREGVFYAPQLTEDINDMEGILNHPPMSRSNYDYFTLKPGERQIFLLGITMLPGYYYHLRVGVQYSYNGDQVVDWSEEEQIVGVPLEAEVWDAIMQPSFRRIGHQQLQSYMPGWRYDEGDLEEAIEKQNEEVQSYRYTFTPPDQIDRFQR